MELIDYKTGNPKTEKKIGSDKDQLLIYKMAARDILGMNVGKLTFHYLNDNSKVSFLGTEKELEKLKEKILGLIEGILATDFEALPSKHNCEYCDFKEVCSFAS